MLLHLRILFENKTESNLRFSRDLLLLHVVKKTLEHLWERLEENGLKWEGSPGLSELAQLYFLVLVLDEV